MDNSNEKYNDYLTVGLIQNTLDRFNAWDNGDFKISRSEENWALFEIKKFISSLYQDSQEKELGKYTNRPKIPDIILLPELSIPKGFQRQLIKIANDVQSIIIAGVDYNVNNKTKEISNEAIIIIPNQWKGKRINSKTMVRYIGKTHAAPKEKQAIENENYTFNSISDVWLFNGGRSGTFGIAICYDLLDLDRLAMYRGKIQHLFILAYNQDTTSFYHAAEAMTRMLFCNVTICNCGYYGGSLSVSPYKEVHRRTIYKHTGSKLGTAQVISLPVESLVKHQRLGENNHNSSDFKSLPSGYEETSKLRVKKDVIN